VTSLSTTLEDLSSRLGTDLAEELRAAIAVAFVDYYKGAPPPGWHGKRLVDSGRLRSDTTSAQGLTVRNTGAGVYELTISTPYARYLLVPSKSGRPALTLVEGADIGEALVRILDSAIGNRLDD
jgi:hypothetical protein